MLLTEPAEPARGVILALHGSGVTARAHRTLSGMDRLAARGWLVAYPQATRRRWFGFRWDLEADIGRLAAVAEGLVKRYPGVEPRVVATGISGGARMACQLASRRPDLVSAVCAVAGLRAPAGRPERPVRVIAFHGTADRLNPYAGGGRDEWQESVPAAAKAWADANGTLDEPLVETLSGLERASFGRPGDPGEVVLWTIPGAGHTWPGAPLPWYFRLRLGRTSRDLDATDEIRRFVLAGRAGSATLRSRAPSART